jgi:hypothetical protein
VSLWNARHVILADHVPSSCPGSGGGDSSPWVTLGAAVEGRSGSVRAILLRFLVGVDLRDGRNLRPNSPGFVNRSRSSALSGPDHDFGSCLTCCELVGSAMVEYRSSVWLGRTEGHLSQPRYRLEVGCVRGSLQLLDRLGGIDPRRRPDGYASEVRPARRGVAMRAMRCCRRLPAPCSWSAPPCA